MMRKLLIAIGDEVLLGALTSLMRRTYDITVCTDGGAAADLIRSLKPDVCILELMLPVKDGFCILEECADALPPVIVCICDFSNDYISQTAIDLGITFMFRKPCLPRAVAARVDHLVRHVPDPSILDGQNKAARILMSFGFNPKNDGFRYLKVGIPLFAQDPQQRICKELYATVADVCGAGSWNQVERSIRSALESAFRSRAEAWQVYFPNAASAPSGKSFVSRIAQELMDS